MVLHITLAHAHMCVYTLATRVHVCSHTFRSYMCTLLLQYALYLCIYTHVPAHFLSHTHTEAHTFCVSLSSLEERTLCSGHGGTWAGGPRLWPENSAPGSQCRISEPGTCGFISASWDQFSRPCRAISCLGRVGLEGFLPVSGPVVTAPGSGGPRMGRGVEGVPGQTAVQEGRSVHSSSPDPQGGPRQPVSLSVSCGPA